MTRLFVGTVRFVLSSGGHIAGIVNPPGPKAWYETGEHDPKDPARWRKAAERHDGSWWEDWTRWADARAGRWARRRRWAATATPLSARRRASTSGAEGRPPQRGLATGSPGVISEPVASLTALLDRWREDLAAWAIPEHIIAAAPDSPWVLPGQVFARRADRLSAAPAGPSFERAWDALEPPGSVLDVGSGQGPPACRCSPARRRSRPSTRAKLCSRC